MNKLLLALITAAFAAAGAYAADATQTPEAKPEAAATATPKKPHAKKVTHKRVAKKAHAPEAAASK